MMDFHPIDAIIRFLHDHMTFFTSLSWGILILSLIQNIVYALHLPAAFIELRRHSQAEDTESSWQLLLSDTVIPISLIVPAFNEEQTIVESVRSTLSLKYPEFEVLVVNDGSKDKTLDVMIKAFSLKPITRAHKLWVQHQPVKGVYGSSLYPNLIVIDKVNGRKADASNAALSFARNPLFCVIDADSMLEGESLLRSIRPFMEDAKMVAVGGTIRIMNGNIVKSGQVEEIRLPGTFLPLVQTMEYIRAFLMARLALSHWGMLSLISGAFGIFNRNIAIDIGGFSHNTVGEDYDLIVKMHRKMMDDKRDYSMRYVPEPVCWTEAPDNLAVLGTQRKRWQRGALEVFFKHRDMFLRPRYGKIGMLALPNNFIIDVLGPLAEAVGYILIPLFWLAGLLDTNFILAFIAMFFLFGVFVSVGSLVLEELELRRVPRARDLALLAAIAVLENFGYRQLNNIWRIMGWWQYLRKHSHWGEMTRTGFKKN